MGPARRAVARSQPQTPWLFSRQGKALARELRGASRRKRKPRSQLVEEALRLWRRSQLERAVKRGYQAMAKKDRASAERRLAAGWEVVK
jgi:hypothetical protein